MHVQQNRHTLQQHIGARPVFLDQVHGVEMLNIGADTPDGLRADGALTTVTHVACTAMVADCLPVLLCDETGTQVAAVHAGWRGLLGTGGVGVLEAMVRKMRTGNTPLLAWLGPCIGPQNFEVGPEVRRAFVDADASAAAFFTAGQGADAGAGAGGKWWGDLPGLARQRLARLGNVAVYGNDSTEAWCTVSQPLRYFSHRRDRVSGRLAACIWRVD